MHPDTFCQHLLISGRVQGVGFRASLLESARTLQLQGWVRNRRDGRVEVLVQGRRPAVDALLRWCQRGPPSARVDAVAASERPIDPGLADMHFGPTE